MALKKPDDILEELEAEMQRGRVYEASLRSSDWVVDGLQSGQDVFVDPRPATLTTLWHELIHRRWPRKGEKAVERLSRQLIAHVDEATKIRWWKAYQKAKIKGRPIDVED